MGLLISAGLNVVQAIENKEQDQWIDRIEERIDAAEASLRVINREYTEFMYPEPAEIPEVWPDPGNDFSTANSSAATGI